MFASCSYISEYSQLMYAIVCKQVLSDVAEHKAEGFFNFDGHRIHKKQDSSGEMWNILILNYVGAYNLKNVESSFYHFVKLY